MGKIALSIRSTLLWTFSRGTWQYDLICALILAFIFLTPPAFFRPGRAKNPPAAAAIQEASGAPSVPSQQPGGTSKTPAPEKK